MAILVLNAGSSSLKYTLFEDDLDVITNDNVQNIDDYHSSFKEILLHVKQYIKNMSSLKAIVHRVVHGGEFFNKPTIIDAKVIDTITSLIPLAPLHNPANIEGIKASIQAAPDVIQIAVFDTAFHQSMPEYAYRYALPRELYNSLHVRRYGFHGSSHEYVSSKAAEILEKPLDSLHVISFHIGNGVSACVIENAKSIDTTMGMTPLEGLMMGTRSGSIDPAIIFYLMKENSMSADEVENLLNKKSGLLGICNDSDVRTIIDESNKGNKEATLALDMYSYRLKKQLGAYMASMNKIDAIIFTGGVGENSAYIREKICSNLQHLGIVLDSDKNSYNSLRIDSTQSSLALLVIPTDEEYQMALHATKILT